MKVAALNQIKSNLGQNYHRLPGGIIDLNTQDTLIRQRNFYAKLAIDVAARLNV
jgi:hypothetical protein